MKKQTTKFVKSAALLILTSTFVTAQTYIAEFKDDSKLWGYISSEGKVLIPCQYTSVSPFSPEGIAVVKDANKIEKYIDIKGNELKLEVEAVDHKEFKEGMAPVKIGEKWGYVNTQGKLVIPAEYKKVGYFHEGRAWVTDFTGKVALFDKQGNSIDISKLGITDYNEFESGFAAVKIGTTWGFIDPAGKLAIENKYLKTGNFSGGLAWVRVGEKQVGYIDKTGKLVINADYQNCESFDAKNGIAAVKTSSGVWQYIDKTGKPLFEKTFLSCETFDPISGLARVKTLAGTWQYVDKSGNALNVNTKKFYNFSEGICLADNNSDPLKYGFIKKDGSWAIDPQYDDANNFENGIATIRIGKLWGLIDKNGKTIIEPKYISLKDFYPVK